MISSSSLPEWRVNCQFMADRIAATSTSPCSAKSPGVSQPGSPAVAAYGSSSAFWSITFFWRKKGMGPDCCLQCIRSWSWGVSCASLRTSSSWYTDSIVRTYLTRPKTRHKHQECIGASALAVLRGMKQRERLKTLLRPALPGDGKFSEAPARLRKQMLPHQKASQPQASEHPGKIFRMRQCHGCPARSHTQSTN